MCRATVGATPVKRWTSAASATFSYGSRGTPCWAKTLNRVPELPNAQDGSSIRWDRSAATTAWSVVTSASVAPRAVLGRMPRRPDRTAARGWDPTRAAEPGRRTPEELASELRRPGRLQGSLPHISIGFNCLLDNCVRVLPTVPRKAIETERCPRSPPGVPHSRRGVTATASASASDVFARERQERIIRLVDEQGRARVTDLAARFGVSAVTIRKDLIALEADHRIVRTHGGALGGDPSRPELAFEVRERLQADEKSRIGAVAATFVGDGQSVVFDASTTALAVARQLKTRDWHQLTVITNGLRLASELAGHPGISVLMLGGRVRWEALSVVGQLGDGLFSRINVQKAFLGAAGFTLGSGLADATEEEAQIKEAMVTAAREVVAIVDHTKWEHAAFATFCPTERLDIVLSDEAAPQAMVEELIGRGIEVRLVGGAMTPQGAA